MPKWLVHADSLPPSGEVVEASAMKEGETFLDFIDTSEKGDVTAIILRLPKKSVQLVKRVSDA